MNLDIKLHKKDLPHEIKFSDKIAIDCEFTGLNIARDRLCLLQIAFSENECHFIKFSPGSLSGKVKPTNLINLLRTKKGGILIEGQYPNGTKGYFGIGL